MAFADNLIENVKLFFSQRFTEVYNGGNLIDQEALSIAGQWDFGVYHLLDVYDAEESEEIDFIPYFDLKDITAKSGDLGLEFGFSHAFPNWRQDDFETLMARRLDYLKYIPESFWQSFLFYYKNIEDADWGSVTSFRVLIEYAQVIAISVITDGDSGYLEVFENEGQILGAARYYSWRNLTQKGSRIAWCEPDWIYSNLRAYPPEIDYKLR